jgi:putative endonuclease
VTNNLVRRIYEHKTEQDPNSFTAKYQVHKLVYYESTTDVRAAIEREKQIKGWNRTRKNSLVTGMNPSWCDLYPDIL